MEYSYTKLGPQNRRTWHWKPLIFLVGALLVILGFLTIPQDSASLRDSVRLLHKGENYNSKPADSAIPNIVHFVRLVDDPSTSTFELPFHQFLAVYSASYYLKPELIYIHTNLDENLLDITIAKSTDPYVQAIRKIPGVIFNYHAAPNETSTGQKIVNLPGKSDFVRSDVLKTYGGIYLDDDVYVLRDFTSLRNMGIDTITGWDGTDGTICPAVMLSKPETPLITAYHTLMDRIYDGSWALHATVLLANLVKDFAGGTESLVLPPDAFFVGGWMPDAMRDLYSKHEDDGGPGWETYNPDPRNDLEGFIDGYRLESAMNDRPGNDDHAEGVVPETWQRDWRMSYAVHGWNSALGWALSGAEKKETFGESGKLNVEYILERKSNLARAVYPALKHALDTSVLVARYD